MRAVTLERGRRTAQSRVLPRETGSSPAARRFVRDVLADWGLTSVQDDAELVVAELVNNAIQHTRTRTLRVIVRRVSANTLRVGVNDKAPGRLPDVQDAKPRDTHGRGLALVDALARSWGYTRWPWAKCVWADLEVPDAS